jgi:hypothetical protein
MLLGLAQFVNFACLSPRTNGEAPWELWYFSTTASAIMGAAAVWQAARFASLDDYELALRPVGEMLVGWLKHDLMELKVVVAVSLALSSVVAAGILPPPVFEWVTVGAALVGIIGNAWLVRRDGQRFWQLYSMVYALPSSKPTS